MSYVRPSPRVENVARRKILASPSPQPFRSHWSKKPSFPLRQGTRQQDRRAFAHNTSREASSGVTETSSCDPSTPLDEGNVPGPHCLLDCQCLFDSIAKGGRWHRRVAVGETLRRLTAKAILVTVSDDTSAQRSWGSSMPSDVGVKNHNNHEERCLLTMDLENAFSQIDRSCFLHEVRRIPPDFAMYCDLCHSNDSFVLFGPENI